ncbi:MAG: tRNA (adenosine(37)-N6)-threonylcarbamoyltransferase complex ATPase subunit type 1 TsaE [Clostridia bacterium]|nr:tRNA (adenosine(37)-N6)-threonylcarbamoyltransferase complex ATPase subunit type 1 TsaE [Clostridia bacterium]
MVMEKKSFITNSFEQTKQVAFDLAKTFAGGEVVLLDGDLGAGKTVFAKGVAQALGISQEVTSPTFAIHNSYNGSLVLNHFDFYRLDESEAEMLGLDEFFGDKNSVCLVEWWSNIVGLLPKNCIKVSIQKIDENTRKIDIL